MWSVGSDVWQLFVGHTRLGLWKPGSPAHWQARQASDDLRPCLERAMAMLPGRTASIRHICRPTIHVWLSGAMARPFLLRPIFGIQGMAEARQYAEGCAAEQTGLDALQFDVWMEGWSSESATLAVATDRACVDLIHHTMQTHGCTLGSVRPWWAAVQHKALSLSRPVSLLAVDDLESFTLLASQKNDWRLAQSAARPASPSAQQGLLNRLIMAEGIPESEVLSVAWGQPEHPDSTRGSDLAVEGIEHVWEWLR